MSKRVVVRVAARGYVDGRYIGEEKEIIEAVDPSSRGKKSRGKATPKNDNTGNSNDNRGNRAVGRGKRGEGRPNPRGATAAGVAKEGGQRRQPRRAAGAGVAGGRDGNVMPGAVGAPAARSPRPPRPPRQPDDRKNRGGRSGGARTVDAPGNAPPPGSDAFGNVNARARRVRGGKKTPFRNAGRVGLAGAGGPAGRSAGGNANAPRALISEVAETRRWGDESKSGQFAEALAKEETVKRERLHKVLAQSGHGSRRDMEIMITSGRVMVNGIVATIGTSVSASDAVMVDRNLVKLKFDEALPRVLLYHKPDGEIVTTNDPGNRITVFDNLPPVENGKWMSIGRLDINTSGLLIFTTSGDLANRLMHPRYEVEREYAVRVLGELTEEQTQRLLDGIAIAADADNDDDDDEAQEARPAKFDSIDKRGGEGANQWYHVVLREGRNREVRKMFEAVGLTVSRLMRVRFGKIGLPPRLTRGRMVELDASQVRAVLKWVGMDVEGHIGALPTNNQPNRGQRGSGDAAVGSGVEGAGRGGPGVRGGRGQRGRGREQARTTTDDNPAVVAGDVAVREFQASHLHEDGIEPPNAALPPPPDRRGPDERPPSGKRQPRGGRDRNARRPQHARHDGQAAGRQPAGDNPGNTAAISDDSGNQARDDAYANHAESPDDAIGNRLVPAAGNVNALNQAATGRRGSGGRGQSHPRGGAAAGAGANAEAGRGRPRGRHKPRNDTDNSGNR